MIKSGIILLSLVIPTIVCIEIPCTLTDCKGKCQVNPLTKEPICVSEGCSEVIDSCKCDLNKVYRLNPNGCLACECVDPCTDLRCGNNSVCLVTLNQDCNKRDTQSCNPKYVAKCTERSRVARDVDLACPPVLPGSHPNNCTEECTTNEDCGTTGPNFCCPNECGHYCYRPCNNVGTSCTCEYGISIVVDENGCDKCYCPDPCTSVTCDDPNTMCKMIYDDCSRSPVSTCIPGFEPKCIQIVKSRCKDRKRRRN